jgi:hypothetical protein
MNYIYRIAYEDHDVLVHAPGLEPKSCSKEIFSLTEGDIYTVFGRYS